ncbi:MAG: TRAP transporter large permease subunit [Bryobacterales bacterium]|nr:TRAP transporter large permease subunit [Bryobacterales bacterium]
MASTGEQLMPPVMGVAALVMAEILQVDYGRIARAGLIPATAFYVTVFLSVDWRARMTGTGNSPKQDLKPQQPLAAHLYPLAPPGVLVGMPIAGRLATDAAVIASLSCLVV